MLRRIVLAVALLVVLGVAMMVPATVVAADDMEIDIDELLAKPITYGPSGHTGKYAGRVT